MEELEAAVVKFKMSAPTGVAAPSPGWRARVSDVETPSQLTPITGWQESPLVSLKEATAHLPVNHIDIHAEISLEFAEEYKAAHLDDLRSPDQLGAVHLYTQAWASDPNDSLYAVLNGQLGSADRASLKVHYPPA